MAQDNGLTSAQGGHSGRRGLTVPPPITQATLKVPQLLLLLQRSVLPLPACLSAEVWLQAGPARALESALKGRVKRRGFGPGEAGQGLWMLRNV